MSNYLSTYGRMSNGARLLAAQKNCEVEINEQSEEVFFRGVFR